MLGIFLIICLAVFWLIKLKIYHLVNDDHIESVEFGDEVCTYNVCYRAAVLHAVCCGVYVLAVTGCIWPYLFIEGDDRGIYVACVVFCIIALLAILVFTCYHIRKSAWGYILISTDELAYKGRKPFSVKVSDIRKVTIVMDVCRIHLKEKGKKSLGVNLNVFYKKKEIRSLMKQLRNHCAKASGRDKSLAHKLVTSKFMVFCKYSFAFYILLLNLLLLYTSYCCIDYDFFKKDYLAQFNALGADTNQTENAWPHYVQAAVNYVELDEDFQEVIKDGLRSMKLRLTDEQADTLRKWFDKNISSWASLKQATSISYCNSTYGEISFLDNIDGPDRNDFSTPSEVNYSAIMNLYDNTNAGCLAGVLDLDWLDMFEMQFHSAKHFVDGKTFLDQLVGYAILCRNIMMFAEQDNYEIEDLKKVWNILKVYFPAGLPTLNIEGEILICCSVYDDIPDLSSIPVQTPLNATFLMYGSRSGTEAYARKRYETALEQATNGIEVELKDLSVFIARGVFFEDYLIAKIHKLLQRTDTYLLASYFLLDLEEYKLIKGSYPVDVSQLREAGLTCQLPDDPDGDGKIIYRNDGQRAILYTVGKNCKDDGGYRYKKGTEDRRDDIIFWERDLKE